MAVVIYNKQAGKALTANFNTNEFDCKCDGLCSKTKIDDKLVKYLQQIREHFNAPITITSGYRCEKHNANVGGASGSRHTKGQACDFVVKGVKPADVAKYAESIGVLGIGLYPDFVHIDTREKKSFWFNHSQEYRETFGGSNTATNSNSTAVSKITVSLPTLQKGSKGINVRVLQALLNIGVDGIFGNATYNAVKDYQRKNALTADGVVGKSTWSALFS